MSSSTFFMQLFSLAVAPTASHHCTHNAAAHLWRTERPKGVRADVRWNDLLGFFSEPCSAAQPCGFATQARLPSSVR